MRPPTHDRNVERIMGSRAIFDVDAAYCISLEARSDRRQLFRDSI